MPAKTFELPKFLTKKVAGEAAKTVIEMLRTPMWQEVLGNPKLHIVILVQKRVINSRKHSPGTILSHILYEHTHDDELAELKTARKQASQHWSGCAKRGTNTMAHLLFSDSSPYCGSVKEEGLVAACYGVPSHYAEMIASFVVQTCIALSQEQLLQSRRKSG